ncbi:MAG: hypothetical protein KIT10_14465 [Flavobacteriales bacterium]|nr:hypothetical protein [Flavobacteriales bacterium]
MNALIQRSNEARTGIQEATGMDDLSYQLLILESGCQCLDDLVRPVGTVSLEACSQYREHLAAIGWWTFYEMAWRAFEVRLWAEWFGPESLVPHQPNDWKREALLKEAYTLRYTAHYARAFDLWMKMVEGKSVLVIRPPADTKNEQTQPQHHESNC